MHLCCLSILLRLVRPQFPEVPAALLVSSLLHFRVRSDHYSDQSQNLITWICSELTEDKPDCRVPTEASKADTSDSIGDTADVIAAATSAAVKPPPVPGDPGGPGIPSTPSVPGGPGSPPPGPGGPGGPAASSLLHFQVQSARHPDQSQNLITWIHRIESELQRTL